MFVNRAGDLSGNIQRECGRERNNHDSVCTVDGTVASSHRFHEDLYEPMQKPTARRILAAKSPYGSETSEIPTNELNFILF